MKVKAVDGHDEPSELGQHIRTACQLHEVLSPLRKDRFALPQVRPDTQGSAEVIEDNGGFGEGPRERRDLGKLMVILPGLEGQAPGRQLAKASAEVLAAIEARGWVGMGISHLGAGIEAGRMANAPKARRRREVGIKHRPHAVPEAKVRKAHNSRRHSRFPIGAAGTHGRDAIHKFRFSHGAKGLGAFGAEHAVALNVDRADDAMAGLEISQEFVQQIAIAVSIPEMVVGIANRPLGVDDRLRHLAQPRFMLCRSRLPLFHDHPLPAGPLAPLKTLHRQINGKVPIQGAGVIVPVVFEEPFQSEASLKLTGNEIREAMAELNGSGADIGPF